MKGQGVKVKFPKHCYDVSELKQRCSKDNCSHMHLLGNHDCLLNYRIIDSDNYSQCHRNGFRRRSKSYRKNQETAIMSLILFGKTDKLPYY